MRAGKGLQLNRSFVTAVPVDKLGALPVVVALVLVYFLSVEILPRWPSTQLNLYVAQPILWGAVAVFVVWSWRRDSACARLPIDDRIMSYAVLAGFFQVVLAILLGIAFGFGRSPYDRHAGLLLLNLWYAGTAIVGQELARWYILVRLGRRHPYLGFAVAWLFCFLLTLPPAALGQLDGPKGALQFAGRLLMPKAGEGLLATYLAMMRGPLASIIYRNLLMAFEWISPVLPDLSWPLAALAGTIVPVLAMMLIEGRVAPPPDQSKTTGRSSGGVGWLLFVFLALIVVWFTNGVFGVRPALISGTSMWPLMRTGDVAVTRRLKLAEVQVGDIIRYRLGTSSVMHRVVQKRVEAGRVVFTTKGDNNAALDLPVDGTQVEGKLVFIVHKVGWLSIWVSRLRPGP